MFNEELMKVFHDDREREIEATLRVRRLLGDRRPTMRWGRRRPHAIREGESRGR